MWSGETLGTNVSSDPAPREAAMDQTEPSPESRKVVDDLEEEIVDLDSAKAADGQREQPTQDDQRAVPGTPEPPD